MRRWPEWVVVPALLTATAVVAAAEPPAKPVEPRVTLSLRGVPLREALAQLYPSEGWEINVDPCIPDTPITADLRDFPRTRALAFMARTVGGPLTAGEDGNTVSVRRSAAAGLNGDGSAAVGVGFQATRITGFSTGPGGVAVPNQAGYGIQTSRRVQPGSPTHLGGINGGVNSRSRNGVPGLGTGSRLRSGSGNTGGTFVTVTVIPDPETDRPRRRSER